MSDQADIWSRGYKTFFMLNTAEHKISIAQENKLLSKFFFLLRTLRCCINILLINVKMPIDCILTFYFISRINFMVGSCDIRKSNMAIMVDILKI